MPDYLLEDQLLDHLAIPESARILWRERITPDFLLKSEEGQRQALQFMIDFCNKHGEPPSQAVIAAEIGYSDFREPEIPIGYLIDALRERYRRREINRALNKVNSLAGTPEEALNVGLGELLRIKGQTMSRRGVFSSDDIDQVLLRYDAVTGPVASLGFPEIDMVLGGIEPETLNFVVARPKRYKSWMLMKSAVEALLVGTPTMFFSLEMPAEEMLARMACMVAKVSWDKYVNHCLGDAERKMFEEARDMLVSQKEKMQIHHIYDEPPTVPTMVQIAKEYDVKVVYIDQISFVKPSDPTGSQWQDIQQICRQMKDATQHWPFYVACQSNREAANLSEMADLSKIGLGDAIGQTGDVLLGMHATNDMREQRLVEFGTMDSRKREIARWLLKVDLSLNSNFRLIERLVADDG